MMRWNAIKKTVRPVRPLKSSHIDCAARCPLSVYIELVCNDNLQALVLSGEPSVEKLELARQNLIAEYNEACGSGDVKERLSLLGDIYKSKVQITGLSVAHDRILSGLYDDCFEFLSTVSIRAKKPKNENEKVRLLKQIASRIKSLSVKLKTDLQKLNKESKDGKAPTLSMFNDQISQVSKYMGFYIDREKVTLLEYAGYLKSLKIELRHGREQKFNTK